MLFAPQLFLHHNFALGDWPSYRPYSEFSRQRWLSSHERTYWNPYVFTGIPAAASLADSRPQYLPDPLLDLSEGVRRLPLFPPLLVTLLTHLLGMLAMALLARRLWGASAWAMAWAGIAFGLTPNLIVPFAFGHEAQFISICLTPVALLLTARLFEARDPRASAMNALLLGVTFGVMCLRGHPQFLFYGAVLTSLFAVERAWTTSGRVVTATPARPGWSPRLARLAWYSAAAGLGAALSAAVWVPAMLYGAISVRGGASGGVSLAELQTFSFSLRDFGALIWPWAVGFGGRSYWGGLRQTDYPQYIGLAVIVLALFAWRGRRDPARRAVLLFGIVGLLAAVSAMGANLAELDQVLRKLFPVLSKFRVAVAALIVTQLCAALLSARGLDVLLLDRRAGHRPRGILALGIAGAGMLVWAGLLAFGPPGAAWQAAAGELHPQMERLSGWALHTASVDLAIRAAMALAFAAGLSFARGRARAPVMAGILLVLVADLASIGYPFLRHSDIEGARHIPSPPAVARLAAAHSMYRAFPLDPRAFHANDWIDWRARALGGEHGAVTRNWNVAQETRLFMSFGYLRAASVGYLTGDSALFADPATFTPMRGGAGATQAWQLNGVLPRAYAVSVVQGLSGEAEVVDSMHSAFFDPHRVAYSLADWPGGSFAGSPGCLLNWVEDSPDRLALQLVASGAAFVVVSDAFAPGWSARLDGKPVPIRRVNLTMRGVEVPPGGHKLEMAYLPEGWAASVAVTRAAMALCAMAGLGLLIVRRSESPL